MDEPVEPRTGWPPRWAAVLFASVAVLLVPWTLYLTVKLPSRHVTRHWDVAWIGFDVALALSFAATAWAAVRRSAWLVPLAAVTATMLVCDAWFDIVTSQDGGEMVEAVALAIAGELPLAAVCAWIVLDAERFLRTLERVRRRVPD